MLSKLLIFVAVIFGFGLQQAAAQNASNATKQASSSSRKKTVTRYETFIYTSDELDNLIQNEEQTRGYMSDLLDATLNAGKTMAGGYVSAFIDLGVSAVGSLFTKNADDKKKWEEVVAKENLHQETLSTEQSINDFYSKNSTKSPMDPLGMKFDGIGCLRKNGNDTVFYISCHINRDKLHRITDHSKFELSLDTLIINTLECNLPNSAYDTIFSFDRRKDLRIAMDIKLTSSWINVQTMLQKEQELGRFSMIIPINKQELNEKGEIRYVRTIGEDEKYKIEGESFIVPRSYMGYRDSDGLYQDSWGKGEYKVEINLKESCGITEKYRTNWKSDWKARERAGKRDGFAQNAWKIIKSQVWNDNGKQWVITTIKAPADMVAADINEALDFGQPATAKTGSSGGSGSGGSGKPK